MTFISPLNWYIYSISNPHGTVNSSISKMEEVAVVVVPFPAQGHLNQLLHLSLVLSSHGLSVHYAASAVHTRQARSRIHGWPLDSISNIHFLDIPVPPFALPPPDPTAPTSFYHLLPAYEACLHLRAPLAATIRSLSTSHRRVIIILEQLMSFTGADVASLPNVEIYSFGAIPTNFHLAYRWDPQSPPPVTPEALAIIEASFEDIIDEKFWDYLGRFNFPSFTVAGSLYNTSRLIEAEFIDLYQKLQEGGEKNKIYAIGPLNPVAEHGGGGMRHECLEWLDRQPEGSVVYVAFGTTCVMLDEQILQLAAGLKNSGQRFLWVLRDADKGNIFADDEKREILRGFEEEVEGVGMVVRGWAPQLEILGHASTGVFISHCGWNSCMESLSMGVPMLAWPVHSDQPRNAMVVTEYLKAGLQLREWSRRKETVTATEVAEAVKRIMVYDEGQEIKRKAKELSQAIKRASQADLGAFIANITR